LGFYLHVYGQTNLRFGALHLPTIAPQPGVMISENGIANAGRITAA
jgi:hypothetical protein